VGLITGEDGSILHSNDAGATWLPLTSGTTEGLNDVSLGGPNNWVVVGANGTILVSTDGGAIWQTRPSGFGVHLNGVDFAGPNTGVAVGNSGVILRTDDGGMTWLGQISDTVQGLADVICVDDDVGRRGGDWPRHRSDHDRRRGSLDYREVAR
jgi:hypothetical protein